MTPHDDSTAFIATLDAQGFKPSRWDDPKGNRQLERKSEAGYPLLRVCLDYQGERQLHSLSVIKFNGQKSTTVEWSCDNMSAYMPSAAVLAMLQAA